MNKILTICGPSASGKSTLEKFLIQKPQFSKVVSFTTRDMRNGEIDKSDYYFIPHTDYLYFKEQGQVAQETHFHGIVYGSYYSEYTKAFEQGKTPVVVIVPNSLPQIQQISKDLNCQMLSIYLNNDKETLITRLLTRDTISGKENYIAKRILSVIEDEHSNWIKRWKWDFIYENYGNLPQDEENILSILETKFNIK